MNTDVIVTKDGDFWFFKPVTNKALNQFFFTTAYTTELVETQALINQCSAWGLTVEAPAFTNYYQPPRLREVSKTRPKGPRHPITGHRI